MSQNASSLGFQHIAVPAERLKLFVTQCLRQVGVPPVQAEVVADSLVFADLRKVSSHGVVRLPIYLKRLQAGIVCATAQPEIVLESGNIAVLNGNNGLGQVNAKAAMEKAIAIARHSGIGACGVKNSNHCGALAYFSMMALEHDMIGLAMTNANPVMAPWGGTSPMLGSNPISMAAPTGNEVPLVIDMAASTVAKGRVTLAAREGKQVPLGWGVNAAGEPTSDPREILKGALLPAGGPKGYALALMIDVLAGVLTDSLFGNQVNDIYDNFDEPQGVGHFMIAISIRHFMSPTDFRARMDRLILDLRESKPAKGVERVYVPGELEFMAERERRRTGVPLDARTVRALEEAARSLGIEPTW